MPITVEGPDGQLHQFPDGTPPDAIVGQMRSKYPQPGGLLGNGGAAPPANIAPQQTQNIPPLPADATPQGMAAWAKGAKGVRDQNEATVSDDRATRYALKQQQPTKVELALDPDFQKYMRKLYPNLKLHPGYAFGADGVPVNLEQWGKDRHAYDGAEAMLQDVKDAGKVLTNTNYLQRWTSNGVIHPEISQAKDAVDHAIVQLTAMVEGKRHAASQDARFLKFFSPQWTDSAETIGFKLDQLNRIFSSSLHSPVGRGDVYKSALQNAVSQAKQRGIIAGPSTAAPSASPAGFKIERVD